MAKAHTSWTVLPHRPIQKLSERVWCVEGDLKFPPIKRVMTIAKRSDGSLVLHNAMALGDPEMAEIEAWGKPAVLSIPNGYHRLDAKVFRDRYPDAEVICPAGARSKIEEVVKVSRAYDEVPPDPAVRFETLEGSKQREGILMVHDSDGTTVVLADVVFNMPHLRGLHGLMFKYVTRSSGGPMVSRISRMFVVDDRVAVRAHLERIAGIPDLRRVVVSHHELIDVDPAGVLRKVAAELG
jgi:hypothetical protein